MSVLVTIHPDEEASSLSLAISYQRYLSILAFKITGELISLTASTSWIKIDGYAAKESCFTKQDSEQSPVDLVPAWWTYVREFSSAVIFWFITDIIHCSGIRCNSLLYRQSSQ